MTYNSHENVDPSEVAKFDEIAYRWWDPESEFKPLHEINPLRLQYIDHYAQLSGKRVIDVGCGGGLLTEAMASAQAIVTGIDMGKGPIDTAKLHLHESGLSIEYQQISAEAFAAENPASFDVVTCMEMLEHVPKPEAIIKACADMLKPGGMAFFSTLNRNPKSYLHAVIGAEYLLKLLPKGTHDYRKFIKPSEISHWLRQSGLSLINIKGLTYNPLHKQYRLTDDVNVNYMLVASKT